jgi:hypothetical protein
VIAVAAEVRAGMMSDAWVGMRMGVGAAAVPGLLVFRPFGGILCIVFSYGFFYVFMVLASIRRLL